MVSAAFVEAADLDLVVTAFLGTGAALAALGFLAVMTGFFAVFAALGAGAFSFVVEALAFAGFAADLGAFAATGLFCFPI